MKSRRLSTLAAAALLAAVLLSGPPPAQAQRGSVTMPAHPKTLLDTLPKIREGWKVTQSGGYSEYTQWYSTNVERHYDKVVLAEDDDPSRPPRTEIRIIDGGRFPGSVASFEGFEPDKESEPKKVFLGSLPAFIYDRGMSGLEARLLASNRYIVIISLEMQPPTELGKWLESIDFRALGSIGGEPITSYPSKATTIFIDELNPEKNRTRTSTISSGDTNKLLSDFLQKSGVAINTSDLEDPPDEPAAPAAPAPAAPTAPNP